MAPTAVQYDLAAFVTSGGKVNGDQLELSIIYDTAITIALDPTGGINVNQPDPGKCNIWFADPLPAPDKAALDAIVAAHQGIGIITTMFGSMPIPAGDITEPGPDWQELESIITTPTFFVDGFPASLPSILGRVILQVKGDGGQIQLVEQIEGQPDVVIAGPQALPDTAGSWATIKMDTHTPPRDGVRNRYCTVAQLNGATSPVAHRSGSISMIHLQIIP
jgi:hypothetical protein